MDVISSLVKNVCNVTFYDLTAEAVEAAKRGIADTIGVMIAGSSVEGCRILVEHIKLLEGPQESTIAVFGGKAPSYLAAQANGAMARALEIDDVSDEFVLHPTVSLIPACIATAEIAGRISGKELITAIALGQDIMFRMAAATRLGAIQSGRYNLFRVFASTAAVGKLLMLSEEQLLNAEGIAYSQMAGDGQSARDGAMTSYIQAGTVAKSAIESVLMARSGITGGRNILQGPCGYFRAIEPDSNLDALTYELGKVFRGAEICIKPYTSCRQTHEAIHLALAIKKETEIDINQIAKVIVRVNDQCYDLVCEPLDQKRQPKTMVDAQFSLPYTVAAALVKGDVFIREVRDEIINDQEILSLAQKIIPIVDEKCQTGLAVGANTMELTTQDGRTIQKETQFPPGNFRIPLSMDDVVDKLKKCVEFSMYPFPKEQTDKLIDLLYNLEGLDEINLLYQLLVPETSGSEKNLR
jgi:2-methylcitrate dehydratase PrpD